MKDKHFLTKQAASHQLTIILYPHDYTNLSMAKYLLYMTLPWGMSIYLNSTH